MAGKDTTTTDTTTTGGVAPDSTGTIHPKVAERGTDGPDPIELDARTEVPEPEPTPDEAPPPTGADPAPDVGSSADRLADEAVLDLEGGIDGKGHDAPPGTGDDTGPDLGWMDATRPGEGDSFSLDSGPDGDFGRGELAYDTTPELGSKWTPSEPANDMSTAAADGTSKAIWAARFQTAQDGGGTKAVKGLLDSVLSGNASDSAKLEAAEAAADVVQGAKAGGSGGDGDPAPPQGTGGTNVEYGEGYVDPTTVEPVDEYHQQVQFENATGGGVIDYGDQVSGDQVEGGPQDYDGTDYGPDYVPANVGDLTEADLEHDPGTIDPVDA